MSCSPRPAPISPPPATAATCSRARASRCGTTAGTPATTCRPTPCSRPRSARCSARSCSRRSPMTAAAWLFALLVRGRFGGRAARSPRSGSRWAPRSACFPAASPSTSASRSGWARCSPPSGAAGRPPRAGAAVSRGEPRGRGVPRARLPRLGARGTPPRPAGGARRRCPAARSACSRGVPRRRHAAVRAVGVLPGARRRAVAVAALIPAEQRTLRIGALLYARRADRRLCAAHPRGRQRRASRRAARRPRSRCCSWRKRHCARAGCSCCSCCSRRCSTGRRTPRLGLRRRGLGPWHIGLLLRAPARRAARASASATAPRPHESRWCRSTDHWEARWMAPTVMLARGWERQLDTLSQRPLLRRIDAAHGGQLSRLAAA